MAAAISTLSRPCDTILETALLQTELEVQPSRQLEQSMNTSTSLGYFE